MEEFSQKYLDKFLSNTLDLKADVRFHVIESVGASETGTKLAAVGRKATHSTMHRIGVLANKEQDMVGRVFHDDNRKVYHIYFLSSEDRSLHFSILFSSASPRYFLVGAENRAVIPDDSNVDPIKDYLSLTFPYAHYRIESKNWRKDLEGEINDDREIVLRYNFYPEIDTFHFTCEAGAGAEISLPSKLLVSVGNSGGMQSIIRLATIVKGKATVLLPDLTDETIDVCLYA